MARRVTEVNVEKRMLDNILAVMEGKKFGKTMAASIVGGEGKLNKLIADGKIECYKGDRARNCKWFCNAAQVLRNCRISQTK